jgi:hypothetical protein
MRVGEGAGSAQDAMERLSEIPRDKRPDGTAHLGRNGSAGRELRTLSRD